ncbi:MAG: MFS transporter [Chloroflexi bacterium]|nr:MFS transporter [Chloroflexota bacterium]
MDNAPSLVRTGSARTGFYYGYVIVFAGLLIMTIAWGTVQSFGVYLKPISGEFGWSRAEVSGAFSTYMVLVGLIYIVAGKFTDRFGPRIVMSVCSLFFAAGHILMTSIDQVWQLYFIYGVLIAIGASGTFVPLAATVARWFVKRRGLMMGIMVSGIGLGNIGAPPLLTWLISVHGWRKSYLIVGVFSLVSLFLLSQLLKRDPSKIGQQPYGYEGPAAGVTEVKGHTFLGAIRTRQLWLLCLAYFLTGISPWTINVHIVPHATDLGAEPLAAANILTIIGVTNILGRVGAGNIIDRIGAKRALMISFSLMLGSLVWLQTAGELWMLYVFAAGFGFGWGGAGTAMTPIIAELFGLRTLGVLVALVNDAWLTGGAIGTVVAGMIFDVVNSYYIAFLIAGAMVLVSLILTSLIKPTHTEIRSGGSADVGTG